MGQPVFFHWKPLLFTAGVAAVAGAVGVMVTLIVASPSSFPPSGGPHTITATTTTTTSMPPETIAVTLPPNDAYSGKVGVAIPEHIIDKLAPPPSDEASKILSNLWPGLSALLGALVGGAVTYATTSQKNKADRIAASEARQQAIDDATQARAQALEDRQDDRQTEINERSLEACFETLKAGRKITASARDLWTAIYNRRPHATVIEEFEAFDATTHDWYPAYEFLRLTVPPGGEPALEEYRLAFGAFTSTAVNWKDAYIDGRELTVDIETGEDRPGSVPVPTQKDMLQQNYDSCERLESAVYAKRDAFVAIVSAYFR
jgi:hypothetical protein